MTHLGTILHEPGGNLSKFGGRELFTSVHTQTRRMGANPKMNPTHHFTDATASASDQHDFTVDTEEILNVEGGHGWGFEKRFGRARASIFRYGMALTLHRNYRQVQKMREITEMRGRIKVRDSFAPSVECL
jgi:hypothetical protein